MTEQEYIALGDQAWKHQDWKQCLNFYSEAIRINPLSIASIKRNMVMKVICYRNTDLLNP